MGSKGPGTSNRIEIRSSVFNHMFRFVSVMKPFETLSICLVIEGIRL